MKLAEVACADCEYEDTENRDCLLCPVFREKREYRKGCRAMFFDRDLSNFKEEEDGNGSETN